VSPVKYEMGFYIPEDDILHSYRCESLKSYNVISIYIFSGCVQRYPADTLRHTPGLVLEPLTIGT
jgi:hypothetical protein